MKKPYSPPRVVPIDVFELFSLAREAAARLRCECFMFDDDDDSKCVSCRLRAMTLD